MDDLAHRYAAAIDAVDPAALLALFAPDGALRIRTASGRVLSELSGERLGAFVRLLGETYESTLHHVTTQVGDTTWCIAHHVRREGAARTLETVGVRYQDTILDGRFALREATALWVKVEPLPRVGLAIDRAVQEERA